MTVQPSALGLSEKKMGVVSMSFTFTHNTRCWTYFYVKMLVYVFLYHIFCI